MESIVKQIARWALRDELSGYEDGLECQKRIILHMGEEVASLEALSYKCNESAKAMIAQYMGVSEGLRKELDATVSELQVATYNHERETEKLKAEIALANVLLNDDRLVGESKQFTIDNLKKALERQATRIAELEAKPKKKARTK